MSKKSDIPVSRESTQPRAPKPNSPPAPWSAFGNLREEMERLFDAFEPSQWFDKGLGRSGTLATDVMLSPAVDLSETEKGYAMTAELPGLTSDQVAVKISNGSLTISGEKSVEEEKEDETYHLRERHWGSFQRSIRLPDDVDRDKISAEFAKGVLTVTLPKSAEALASERKIAVKPV